AEIFLNRVSFQCDWGHTEGRRGKLSRKQAAVRTAHHSMTGERLMSDSSYRQELQAFAVELRKLAYTMPAGHEDRLLHLSERMVGRARQLLQVDAHAM
ncbi:MAG TPA: hypothetical protein PKM47_20025, partial [Mycobacterium sp.]|nr:hypothetical protein [Mycobacterium sp.]